jgi:large-conductance mechanosensitive channel
MKDRSLLFLIAVLMAVSVVIDFANAILSRLADGIIMAMVGYLIWTVMTYQRARLAESEAAREALELRIITQMPKADAITAPPKNGGFARIG